MRLFAGLREREGADHVELDLPDDARAADVLAAMGLRPGQCIVALDREYAPADEPVRADHEVALIPPVSGGSDVVRLVDVTEAPLDLAAVAAAVRDPRAGAVVCFEGVTRDVEALDYEAYVEMAREKLAAIGAEEAERHGLCAVALVHRVGRVPLSEPSVIVAASAAHRGEAFAGARALIDRVKAEAPIWKVELTDEGARRVEGVLPEITRALRGARRTRTPVAPRSTLSVGAPRPPAGRRDPRAAAVGRDRADRRRRSR